MQTVIHEDAAEAETAGVTARERATVATQRWIAVDAATHLLAACPTAAAGPRRRRMHADAWSCRCERLRPIAP